MVGALKASPVGAGVIAKGTIGVNDDAVNAVALVAVAVRSSAIFCCRVLEP